MDMVVRRRASIFFSAVFCVVATLAAFAQESQPEPKKYLSPQARLVAARNVYLRNAGGSDIPFNVIQSGIESWPRYTIVNSPEKADLIIEVLSPEESPSNSSSSKTKVDAQTGGHSSTTAPASSSSLYAVRTIKLTVSDARTRLTLFSATQTPKDAWKDRVRTESQIECAQKLLTLFHNRVEPPETTAPEPSPK